MGKAAAEWKNPESGHLWQISTLHQPIPLRKGVHAVGNGKKQGERKTGEVAKSKTPRAHRCRLSKRGGDF